MPWACEVIQMAPHALHTAWSFAFSPHQDCSMALLRARSLLAAAAGRADEAVDVDAGNEPLQLLLGRVMEGAPRAAI